ncbi:MAG: DUF1127 domain-containing protein [Xanthobacteraceae bacterium]|jgi:uncharacterized protein YjiS (DUF1127 family)
MFSKTKTAFLAAIATSTAVDAMHGSNSASRTFRLSRWSQVKRDLAEWRVRARSRNELMNLNDRLLRDIGVSPYEAVSEASKPFWMA